MSKKLTLDDLIIEEHPGGQNCRSCPLFTMDADNDCIAIKINGITPITCFTHTIALKPATDEQL